MSRILTFFLIIGITLGYPEVARIQGGLPATSGQFPYQVSIEVNGMHYCGGSILSETIIISAAHCTSEMPHDKLTIRSGSVESGRGGQVSRPKKIVDHSEWNPRTIQNDITIIQLETPIIIDNITTKVIKLAKAGKDPIAGSVGIVSGFGLTTAGGKASDVLLYVAIPVMGDKECKKIYGNLVDTMFCAGYADSGVGAKSMDSGGPLVVNGRLAGIVSFGIPTAGQVYTKVSAYRSWIASTIDSLN